MRASTYAHRILYVVYVKLSSYSMVTEDIIVVVMMNCHWMVMGIVMSQ